MKEITEDYVSFETAKLLNEKGFKQECDYATSWYAKQYYKNSCQGEWFEGEHQIIEDIDDKCNISYLSDKNIFIPAPTLQMAMKYLREVHNFHVYITYDGDRGYQPNIYNLRTNHLVSMEMYNGFKHEEALETAIVFCLENLI